MRLEKSWHIRAMRKCKSDEIRDRLLEVQKIKKKLEHSLSPYSEACGTRWLPPKIIVMCVMLVLI